MLTIANATRIVVDEMTELTGTLVMRDGVVSEMANGKETAPERVTATGAVTATENERAANEPQNAETLDASGCVVTPGLVNAHHHLLQSAFRTLPGTRGVAMRDWLPTMAAAYTRAGVDADLAAVAASVGVAEGLLCGVTTVADHHLTWPSGADSVAIATATADAARALGGRLVFVRGSARDDPQEAASSAEAIVQALLPRTGDGMLQLAVGPAGVHSDSRETFELLAQVAARHGLRRRTQANEQVDVAIALEKYGKRPIDLLEDWGWLESDVTLAHLCDVTGEEIRRLAASGITATHAPGCDLPMGWGIAPVAALRAAGIVVGLGTSGGGSNDAGHLLVDARLAMQVAPLVGPPIAAREVLAMAMAGSAAGLGRPELGNLRPGSAADLCVWDVSGVADAGVADPVAGLLWANPGRRPKHVVVAGRLVVRDYELVDADERELVARLSARVPREA
ncbi:amidohydrolase family protein [Lacisediminihabitans sp. H27-G8]|uniref:amidohydrolase family protein n=1 Tax=Lacisediminihabitans sp. H27-G8 TaxID=3111909 RepID=UPI0038FCE4D9